MRKSTMTTHFAVLPDPRQQAKCAYQLTDLLTAAIAAVVCGCDAWTDVSRFCVERLEWLRTFTGLERAPSHDTFSDLFGALNYKAFEKLFIGWARSVEQATKGDVVAIDGKVLRRAHSLADSAQPLALITAWRTRNGMCIGANAVEPGSNEIPQARRLLAMLDIAGCVITADAAHCNEETAALIVKSKADYVLAVKGNQPYWAGAARAEFARRRPYRIQLLRSGRGHGRTESQKVEVVPAPLSLRTVWPGLRTFVRVTSSRDTKDAAETAERYFMTSLPVQQVARIADAVRAHWRIENCQHWVLDMCFAEDYNRTRLRNGARNLALIRRMCLNLIRLTPRGGGASIKVSRKAAGWNPSYCREVLRPLAA